MADEIRPVPHPASDIDRVGATEVNSSTSSLASPQSPMVNNEGHFSTAPTSPMMNNEKHFSTAPTLHSPGIDKSYRGSYQQQPEIRQQTIQYQQQPETNSVPYSPLYARNDYRNTGTWQDAAYPKKPDYDVEAREMNPDDGIDWKPGMRSQFPWIGFAGFVTIIIATAMAVAILGLSDGKRVTDWPTKKYTVQPNVVLNIANQVQNLGLITLIAQGLAIAWWRKALRGTSLKTLHRNHAYSYSFYAIVTSGRHFNIIALAALMAKFAVVDSTLFQKATKTIITQEKNYMNTTVTAWIENEWKPNTGGIPGDEGNIKTVDAAWANVLDAYNGKIANFKVHDLLDEYSSFFGCPYRQECSGKVNGLGFAFSCQTETQDVDYGLQRLSGNTSIGGYPLWDVKFEPDWSTDSKAFANVRLEMLYVDSHAGASDGSCPGTLTRRTCLIRPAVVEYPVTVMKPSEEELKGKNIVTHIKFNNDNKDWNLSAPLDGEQIDDLRVIEYTDLNERFNSVSTVGAMTYVFNNLFSSSANLTYTTAWDIQSRGSQAQSIFYADNDRDDHSKCYYDIDKPGVRDDPAIELLRKLNTFAFTAALYVTGAPATVRKDRIATNMAHQDFEANVTGIVEQYKTSFKYVGGALAATFITVILVLPVYWGFWQLGRKVTLGPLEISHAFNAPIIAPDKTKNHHGDFDEVLNEVGKRRVQYGQLVGAPPGQMGLAEPTRVAMPSARHGGRVMHNKSNRRMAAGAAFGGILAATIGANAK